MTHRYTFGIEEEYFLADRDTGRSPSQEVAEAYHHAAKDAFQVAEHELLVGQIEVATEPGSSIEDAFDSLQAHRRDLSTLAAEHDLHLFAAGSHPLAVAVDQHVARTDRYKRLGDELKLIAPKAPVSAMHVHVEVPDPAERVLLINRLIPFLPLLLALSVSSPFWEGRNSGLQGYRLTAFAQWPRTGLPGFFATSAQYEAYIRRLGTAGFVEDASMVWSHIRPSVHYPTIEMRICDACTRLADAVAIAALFRALVRAVVRRPEINSFFGPVEHALCGVNLWRAQQGGRAGSFADIATERTVDASALLNETLELVSDDFEALDMSQWQKRLQSGVDTSADRQLQTYENALRTQSHEEALRAVVRSLAEATIAV